MINMIVQGNSREDVVQKEETKKIEKSETMFQ